MKSANDMTFDQCWDALIDLGMTYNELELACNLKGNTKETLLDCLYARTGYRDFDQLDDGE